MKRIRVSDDLGAKKDAVVPDHGVRHLRFKRFTPSLCSGAGDLGSCWAVRRFYPACVVTPYAV